MINLQVCHGFESFNSTTNKVDMISTISNFNLRKVLFREKLCFNFDSSSKILLFYIKSIFSRYGTKNDYPRTITQD